MAQRSLVRSIVNLVVVVFLVYLVYTFALSSSGPAPAKKAPLDSGDVDTLLEDENIQTKSDDPGSDVPKVYYQHDDELAVFQTPLGTSIELLSSHSSYSALSLFRNVLLVF